MCKFPTKLPPVLASFKLPFTDAFTRTNGALGSRWSGATWSISANQAINTPTLGPELLTDGALENWNSAADLASWSENKSGSSTINREGTIVHGGSYSCRLDVDASNSAVYPGQNTSLPLGAWVQASAWLYASASGKTAKVYLGSLSGPDLNPGPAWTQYFHTFKVAAANPAFLLSRQTAASASLYWDDASLKALTLAQLFAALPPSKIDVAAQVVITANPSGCQAGLVINLDNPANPANFVYAYYSAGLVKMIKCVAGAYTELVSGSATFGSAKPLKIVKSGTSYSVYYGGVQIGATQTVNDAGIINNRIHGLFSTHSGITLDAYSLTSP